MGGGLSSARAGGYRYGIADTHADAGSATVAPVQWIGQSLDLPSKTSNIGSLFSFQCVLGTGMLGRVRLVQSRKTKKYYALKSMKKTDIMDQSMLRHVESEREALQRLTKLQHPFLTKYFGTLQTPGYVHLVLEYVPGGELLRRLHQLGRLPNDEAKFYATELIVFVEFCHSQNYMYRDLKPENVLLDAQGHIKVVDLGFVRRFLDPGERCTTSVGTPQYLAPEQLTQSKEKRCYTSVVDWWAIGCMIFELVSGRTPFANSKSDTPFEIYTRILQGKVQWPSGLQHSLKDLLKRMLVPDVNVRLCEAEAIRQHSWFSHVDWQDVRHRDVHPPFQPRLTVDGDHTNFEDYPDDDAAMLSEFDGKGRGGAVVFAQEFRNF